MTRAAARRSSSTADCACPRCRCRRQLRCQCHDYNALIALALWDFSRSLRRRNGGRTT